MKTLSLTPVQVETLALVLDWAVETGFLDVDDEILKEEYEADIEAIKNLLAMEE
jgi:hypothetical protein